MSYRVSILDTQTGVVAVTEFAHQPDEYWWTEGNFGCDCNRFMSFKRALGENPDPYSAVCGSHPNRYLVNAGDFLKEFDE